jgi:hypothetical protein
MFFFRRSWSRHVTSTFSSSLPITTFYDGELWSRSLLYVLGYKNGTEYYASSARIQPNEAYILNALLSSFLTCFLPLTAHNDLLLHACIIRELDLRPWLHLRRLPRLLPNTFNPWYARSWASLLSSLPSLFAFSSSVLCMMVKKRLGESLPTAPPGILKIIVYETVPRPVRIVTDWNAYVRLVARISVWALGWEG